MKLTKYNHACVVLEKNNENLVIDSGNYSLDFEVPDNTVGVVITHVHADHFDKAQLNKILASNPDAAIFTTDEVAAELDDPRNVNAVKAGQKFTIGTFELEFFGGDHAIIHGSIPTIQNIGVLINSSLYYPGDSLTLPGKPIQTLLAPASAPWMKISEAMDFIAEVKPRQTVIPTHDAILSDQGKQLADRILSGVTEQTGSKYQRLNSGESLVI